MSVSLEYYTAFQTRLSHLLDDIAEVWDTPDSRWNEQLRQAYALIEEVLNEAGIQLETGEHSTPDLRKLQPHLPGWFVQSSGFVAAAIQHLACVLTHMQEAVHLESAWGGGDTTYAPVARSIEDLHGAAERLYAVISHLIRMTRINDNG